MGSRLRTVIALVSALAVLALVVPASVAKAKPVPKVYGLAAAGSNLTAAKLGLKWRKVAGASYQVRWASSTKALPKAKVYATTKTTTTSPPLGNVCATWYAQVRAKKGGKLGPWSVVRSLKFSGLGAVTGATLPNLTNQPSTKAVQVRWARKAGATGYRVHYSAAPYGNWPGYFPYSSTVAPSATAINLPLPAVGPKDRFTGVEYGNPLFVQLETKRCNGSYAKSPTFPAVWPRPLPPGDATTGNKVAFGSYNLKQNPNSTTQPTKMANLATNIFESKLDVIALQEADASSAKDMVALMETLTAADWDWADSGVDGNMPQQIIFRTDKYTETASGDVGQPTDGTAATPLRTPWVRLTPADPAHRDIFVTSIHLEDRTKFFPPPMPAPTVVERKADANAAAKILLTNIAAANVDGLPVLAAGDFKGNFGAGGPTGAGYCDEGSTPACLPEGQPTFIRGGFIDAQGAASRTGVQYGTVNKHVANQPAALTGFGGRADFLVFKGLTGVSKYVNVRKTYGDASETYQSDHNLIYAEVYVPFK